jgi:hypothetical protein
MENYVVRFNEHERDAVLNILSRSNDIIINNVEPTSVGITIQLEESAAAYTALLEQIERELHPTTVVVNKSPQS